MRNHVKDRMEEYVSGDLEPCALAIFEQHVTPVNRAGVHEEAVGVALDCLPARRASVFWHRWHFI